MRSFVLGILTCLTTTGVYLLDIERPLRISPYFLLQILFYAVPFVLNLVDLVWLSSGYGSGCANDDAVIALGFISACMNMLWLVILSISSWCHHCLIYDDRVDQAVAAGIAASLELDDNDHFQSRDQAPVASIEDILDSFIDIDPPLPPQIPTLPGSTTESSPPERLALPKPNELTGSTTTAIPPQNLSIAPVTDAKIHEQFSKRHEELSKQPEQFPKRREECCSVCLESLWPATPDRVNRKIIVKEIKKCGHRFHAPCILPWIVNRKNSCPLCRSIVVPSSTSASGIIV